MGTACTYIYADIHLQILIHVNKNKIKINKISKKKNLFKVSEEPGTMVPSSWESEGHHEFKT